MLSEIKKRQNPGLKFIDSDALKNQQSITFSSKLCIPWKNQR